MRLFGEYEKQRATVILFPYRKDVWRKDCKPIEKMIVELANVIAEHQPVIIGVLPGSEKYVAESYRLNKNVEIVPMKYNDCWARDTIGSVVMGEDSFVSALNFNAYGGTLYKPWNDDEALDGTIAKYFGYKIKEFPIVMEWGNLLTDGNGTVFVVKDSILNPNRNPDLTLERATEILKQATASKQVVWIERGLVGDETGGHVDNLLAFADRKRVLLSWTDDKDNPQYEIVREVEALLKGVTNVHGEAYEIIHLPVPGLTKRSFDESEGIVEDKDSLAREEGGCVLETYVNFAIANGVIVVPQFGHKKLDKEAIDILKAVFADRRVVGLDGREAALGGGGFHCLTKHVN